MKLATLALLTVGTIAIAAPALADDFVGARVGPVGVGVDVGHRDRDRVVVRERDRDGYARGHCKTTIIHRDGMTKKIKKCD
jgi:hypothetical protein